MTAFTVQMIPVRNIAAPSYVRQQNGHDKESLTQLAASIKAQGLLQPIVVRPSHDPETEALVIIAGRRRLAACKLAEMDSIPCVVVDTDEARGYEMEIAENIQREQMTLADTARAVRTLMTIYNNQKTVCEVLNKSPAWVSKHLAVTSSRCPGVVQEMLDQGLVTDLETLHLVKAIAETPASNPNAFSTLQRMMKLAQSGNLSRPIARDALAKLREPAVPANPKPTMQTTTTRQHEMVGVAPVGTEPYSTFTITLPIKYMASLAVLATRFTEHYKEVMAEEDVLAMLITEAEKAANGPATS